MPIRWLSDAADFLIISNNISNQQNLESLCKQKVLPLCIMTNSHDKPATSQASPRPRMMADIDVSMRPREKAIAQGFDSLTDAELLAIIFNTGTRDMNVVELSRTILDDNDGHLSRLVRMSHGDIMRRYKGIGPAKALTLLAALQLGIRAAQDESSIVRTPVRSSADIATLMQPRMRWLANEEFRVLHLSKANEVMSEQLVGKGGLDATVVDVRLIIREALQLSASSIACVHNHPSGTLRPSPQDIALTRKLKEAAAIFDIRLLDHIIISAGKGYFSFADEGIL